MIPETQLTETPSFVEALERLEELSSTLHTGDLDERLGRLPGTVAEAHRLKRILLDRAVEVREAIACLRGNARPARST